MPCDLILTREFPPQDGGIAVIAYEIAKQLSSEGKKVLVLTWQYPVADWPSLFEDSNQGFTIIRIKPSANRWFQMLRMTFAALKCVGQFHVRRIWATSWNFSGVSAALIKVFMNIPFIVMTQGYEVSPQALTRSDRVLMKFCFHHANKIFAISRFTKALVDRWTKGRKTVDFIPHGVDANRFHPRIDGTAVRQKYGIGQRKVMLTVARLFPRKGHDIVIEALPEIVKSVPEVFYLVVGMGPQKEILKKRISELKLDSYVAFTGFIQDAELPAYYAACDLFVLPNREISDPKDPWAGDFEGFGVVFVEAAACGKPVIAGRSGGAPDAVQEGETGVLVDPLDPHAFAQAAIQFLNDPGKARRFGDAGRVRAENELSWPHLVRRYEALFS